MRASLLRWADIHRSSNHHKPPETAVILHADNHERLPLSPEGGAHAEPLFLQRGQGWPLMQRFFQLQASSSAGGECDDPVRSEQCHDRFNLQRSRKQSAYLNNSPCALKLL